VAVVANGEGTGDEVVIYAAAPARANYPPAPNPDLARLRAEVEEEIRRDNDRLFARAQACARSGASARQGCIVATPPKRFASAGA
jgi:hypothetical protein